MPRIKKKGHSIRTALWEEIKPTNRVLVCGPGLPFVEATGPLLAHRVAEKGKLIFLDTRMIFRNKEGNLRFTGSPSANMTDGNVLQYKQSMDKLEKLGGIPSGHEYVQGDMRNIPLKRGSVDTVVEKDMIIFHNPKERK